MAGRPMHSISLRELAAEMNSGQVDTLLILGGNPAYTAPGDIKFADALLAMSLAAKSRQEPAYSNFTAHLGFYGSREDETGFPLPMAASCKLHYLESWGDGVRLMGTCIDHSAADRADAAGPQCHRVDGCAAHAAFAIPDVRTGYEISVWANIGRRRYKQNL